MINTVEMMGANMVMLNGRALWANESLGIEVINPGGFDFTDNGRKQLALAITARLCREYHYPNDTSIKHYHKMFESVTSKMEHIKQPTMSFDFELWAKYLFPDRVPVLHYTFIDTSLGFGPFGWLYQYHPEGHNDPWVVITRDGHKKIKSTNIHFTKSLSNHLNHGKKNH